MQIFLKDDYVNNFNPRSKVFLAEIDEPVVVSAIQTVISLDSPFEPEIKCFQKSSEFIIWLMSS